ncbi:MAG: hypothetical protein QW678_02635 [Candidatus Aenigmatarchaeota archaeon]
MEERILRINLRKELIKKPTWNRKKLLMLRLKEKLKRILKVDEIKIGKNLNEFIQRHSPKKLTYKFTLRIEKEDNIAKVDLA